MSENTFFWGKFRTFFGNFVYVTDGILQPIEVELNLQAKLHPKCFF